MRQPRPLHVSVRLTSAARLAAALPLLALLACDDGPGGGGGCASRARATGPMPVLAAAATTDSIPTAQVEVLDSATLAPLAADASGFIYRGAVLVDSLRHVTGEGHDRYLLSRHYPFDTYRLQVTHPGYQTWERDSLRIGGPGMSSCAGPRIYRPTAVLQPDAAARATTR